MRNHVKLIVVIVATCFLNSCDSFLGETDNPIETTPTENNTEAADDNNGDVGPIDGPVTAHLFSSEKELQSAVAAVYLQSALMETHQQTLEAFRLKKISSTDFGAESITADNDILSKAWNYAYTTISRANLIIRELKDNGYDYDVSSYLAEVIALRSFAYYQITTLWGDAPFLTEETDVMTYLPRTDKNEILTYAYERLDEVKDKFNSTNGQAHIGALASKTLMAEILLSLGKNDEARTLLDGMKENVTDAVFSFNMTSDILQTSPSAFVTLLNGSESLDIYGKQYFNLLLKEASGDVDLLSDTWSDSGLMYGEWAALKRLGTAQQKTGCAEWELLFLIPFRELILNPLMTQNPTY